MFPFPSRSILWADLRMLDEKVGSESTLTSAAARSTTGYLVRKHVSIQPTFCTRCIVRGLSLPVHLLHQFFVNCIWGQIPQLLVGGKPLPCDVFYSSLKSGNRILGKYRCFNVEFLSVSPIGHPHFAGNVKVNHALSDRIRQIS